MKTTTVGLLAVLFIGFLVLSCDTKDPDTDPVSTGKMRIVFDNTVGASDLKLGTGSYQNSSGEAHSIK